MLLEKEDCLEGVPETSICSIFVTKAGSKAAGGVGSAKRDWSLSARARFRANTR